MYLFYNTVLVSAIHQHESAIHMSPPSWTSIHLPPHPTALGGQRTRAWAPYVTLQIPTDYILYMVMYMFPCHSHMALVVKKLPVNAGDIRDAGLISGLGRSPGEGNGNPLQCSCLENPMDRGAWRAMAHRVTQSRTWTKWLSSAPFHTASMSLFSVSASPLCMDTEILVHIYNGKLLSFKKERILVVLMRWMKPEPIVQGEVSHKEKDKYCMLTYVYGI